MTFPHIALRAFNTPLLVAPRKAGAFLHGFGPRLLGGSAIEPKGFGDLDPDAAAPSAQPFASLLGGDLQSRIQRNGSGYGVVGGVAIVPVSGVLIHRGAWIGESSGQTSYEGLRAQVDAAAEDPQVKAIALEIDSFGGEVSGCFDLADRIRAIGRTKPVRAFVVEHAYSAAYAIASQADRIVVPRSGGVGSIGVMCMHVDISAALKEGGVTVTLIHAGAHKVDGNPYEPLDADVHAELRAEMESLRKIFAATVGAGRGSRLTAAGALATEARCLGAAEAVKAGLADSVVEPRAAFEAFIDEINQGAGSARNTGGPAMGKRLAETAATEEDDPVVAEAPEDEERAETDSDETASASEGEAAEDDEDGAGDEEDDEETSPEASLERKRIAAILDSPHARGRDGLARHLALNTGMSPKAAIAVLKASPNAAGALGQRMAGSAGNLAPAAANGGKETVSAATMMKARFASR